jgi:hypothetical protein
MAMTNTTMTKTRVGSQVQTETAFDVVGKGTVAVMGGISVLVGLWAVACFVGAMVASGGPLALVQSWISAVTGA